MADNDAQLEIELEDDPKAAVSDIKVEKVDDEDKKSEVGADEGIARNIFCLDSTSVSNFLSQHSAEFRGNRNI